MPQKGQVSMAQSYIRSPEQKKRDVIQKRQWYLKNREEVLAKQKSERPFRRQKEAEYQRIYRIKNKEHLAEQKKKYYLANKEWIIEYKKEHSRNNRDKINAYRRVWERLEYQNDPTKVLLKYHARRAKTKTKINKENISNWESKICGICYLLIEGAFHIDHITPISKGGLHEIENLQLAHPFCNLSKKDKLIV